MVIISKAVDDADPLAAANGARAPRPAPAANNFEPAAALSPLFDVVHGTTATTADVGAGTTPWWSSQPPNYAASTTTATSSGAYVDASSSFPPPPSFQSHGDDDLACYAAGSVTDTLSFLQPPVPSMAPEPLSYFYFPQLQGFPPPPCFASPPSATEPSTIWPELQLPTTAMMQPPASVPPPSVYPPQTQGTTTTVPALADTQEAQEDTRPTPRRRGRPSKRALAVSSEPPPPVSKPTTKRVAVGSNRAASSSSQMISSAAVTGSGAMLSSSAAGQVPEQAGGSSSSTGSTSDQQTAACTSANHTTAMAPPELTTATGPQYADTSAVGVRFQPTDQELVGYLRLKYAQQEMPVKFFKEFDVYQAHPMAIKGACGESQDGCWYAFSPRDRKYRNGKRPARSVFAEGGGGQQQQVGFWKSNSKLGDVRAGGRKDGAVIGRMTSLTFQVGRQPRGKQTGWKMKEYTIPENQHQPDGSAMLLNDWVVCKLFYKERPTCTNTTDEDAIVSVVAVGQEEDGACEAAAGESVQGGEDMQPQVAPAAHQASDYSEQDLCVEDYLVCDVAFAQQNDDAANCTI